MNQMREKKRERGSGKKKWRAQQNLEAELNEMLCRFIACSPFIFIYIRSNLLLLFYLLVYLNSLSSLLFSSIETNFFRFRNFKNVVDVYALFSLSVFLIVNAVVVVADFFIFVAMLSAKVRTTAIYLCILINLYILI